MGCRRWRGYGIARVLRGRYCAPMGPLLLSEQNLYPVNIMYEVSRTVGTAHADTQTQLYEASELGFLSANTACRASGFQGSVVYKDALQPERGCVS